MFNFTQPTAPFVDNQNDPISFVVGTQTMVNIFKQASKQIDYWHQQSDTMHAWQSLRNFAEFIDDNFVASLVTIRNIIPQLTDLPSGNTEEDNYIRYKARFEFEEAMATFLHNALKLKHSEPPVYDNNPFHANWLVKEVATETVDVLAKFFNYVIEFSKNTSKAKQFANANGSIQMSVSLNLPDSYDNLLNWLKKQSVLKNKADTLAEQKEQAEIDKQSRSIARNVVLIALGIGFMG